LKKDLVSINKFSEIHKFDRRTVSKYVADAGLTPKQTKAGVDYYEASELLAALENVQAAKAKAGVSGSKREQKLDEEIRKLRIANDEKEKLVVLKTWVAGKNRDLADRFKGIVYSKLVDELPADLSNDVATNRVLLRNTADRLLAEVQSWSREFQKT
jgi:predicted transcriptional regulator